MMKILKIFGIALAAYFIGDFIKTKLMNRTVA